MVRKRKAFALLAPPQPHPSLKMILRLQFFLQSLLLSLLLVPIISSSNLIPRDDQSSSDQEEDNIDALIDSPSPTVKSLSSLNFDQEINDNNHQAFLIEFFQPWCHYCQDFAPTWQDLCEINDHLQDTSHFGLRRVNCENDGDLCSRENVKGYPYLGLYYDGKFVEKYKGELSP